MARRLQSPGALRLLCLAAAEWGSGAPTTTTTATTSSPNATIFVGRASTATDDSASRTLGIGMSALRLGLTPDRRGSRPRAHSNLFDIFPEQRHRRAESKGAQAQVTTPPLAVAGPIPVPVPAGASENADSLTENVGEDQEAALRARPPAQAVQAVAVDPAHGLDQSTGTAQSGEGSQGM